MEDHIKAVKNKIVKKHNIIIKSQTITQYTFS